MGEGSGNGTGSHKNEEKKEQKTHFQKIEEEIKVIKEDDNDSSSGVAFSESVYSMASRSTVNR